MFVEEGTSFCNYDDRKTPELLRMTLVEEDASLYNDDCYRWKPDVVMMSVVEEDARHCNHDICSQRHQTLSQEL